MLLLRWSLLFIGLFVLVVFQTSASPSFPIFGVGPQLALIVLCCWAMIRPPIETLVMIPLAGVGLGLLAFQGMAESVAALAPIGLVALSRRGVSDSQPLALEWAITILLIGAASIWHFTTHAVAVELTTSGVNWIAAIRTVMLGGMLGNMLVGAVVYWLIRIPTSGARSAPAPSRTAWS